MATTRRGTLERLRDVEHQRVKEQQRNSLLQSLRRQALIESSVESERRVDQQRRHRDALTRENEYHRERLLDSAESSRLARIQASQEEEKSLMEALETKRKAVCLDKVVQSIRDNSVEIRELEQKLNYAYVNKERAAQIYEKKLSQERNKLEEARLAQEFKERLNKLDAEENSRKLEKVHRSQQYKASLQAQLGDREKKRHHDVEQFIHEKQMIDELVRRIMDEDLREAQNKVAKQQETRHYIDLFMKDREAYKRAEQARIDEENSKIQQYADLQRKREDELKSKKNAQESFRNGLYDKLAAEVAEKEMAKNDLEALQAELYMEELEEKEREKERNAMANRIRKRLELIEAFKMQMEARAAEREQARQEEAKFREQMMKKFAEDERIELMSEQRRRMKQQEHKRAVDSMVAARAKALEQEEALAAAEQARYRELESFRQQVVEQERQRLLREHASRLVGFLPKGVLRDESDLEAFDDKFKTMFTNRKS